MLKPLRQQHKTLYLTLGLGIAAYLSVWLFDFYLIRLTAAAFLLFFWPGWLLLLALRLTNADILERFVLAGGVSYGLTVFSALGVLYTTGRLSGPLALGVVGLMSLILTGVYWSRSTLDLDNSQPLTWLEVLRFLIPIAVAAFFSFTNIGYSDYWGDEMNGLLRAIAIIAGPPEALFEHTKGPVEVLLPATFGLLVGRFEPFTLRFPFALAHLMAVAGYYLLARRMFDQNVALLAALLLAINGLYLAFARIIQYQVIVFLMTSLSLLLVYAFYRGNGGKYLGLSAFLMGVGLLAHYDMLLVLPPIVYLIWQHYRQPGQAWRKDWLWLAGAGAIAVVVVASFYLPFLLQPHFASTSSYLNRIIGPAHWPVVNFDELYVFAVMYNSVYYVIFITLLGVGQMVSNLAGLRRDKWLWGMIGGTLSLSLLAIMLDRAAFAPVLVFTLLFTLLIFSTKMTELRIIYVWLGVSFVGYVFFVDHPRTHLQIIYPGWSLLAALAVSNFMGGWQRRMAAPWRPRLVMGTVAVLGILFGLFAGYQYRLFVDAQREYVLTYPEHKSQLYWEDPNFPFGSRRLYGAPHRLGWQMINQLYTQHYLQGDWNSNDDGSNLFWYTLGSPRNPCYPRYYFLTQFEQDEDAVKDAPPPNLTDYMRIGQVWNHDRLQIDVYEFAPTGPKVEPVMWAEPARYPSFVIPSDFRSLPYSETAPNISTSLSVPPHFRLSPAALQQIATHYGDPRILDVRDTVALVGYDLDDSQAQPSGWVTLTLYWQAKEIVNLPYKIFVHLETGDSTDLRAQSDDFPVCGTRSTQLWQVDQIITDRHILHLPANIPSGESYILRVGLYESQTGLRMDRLDTLGNPQGVSFDLAQVTIRSGDK